MSWTDLLVQEGHKGFEEMSVQKATPAISGCRVFREIPVQLDPKEIEVLSGRREIRGPLVLPGRKANVAKKVSADLPANRGLPVYRVLRANLDRRAFRAIKVVLVHRESRVSPDQRDLPGQKEIQVFPGRKVTPGMSDLRAKKVILAKRVNKVHPGRKVTLEMSDLRARKVILARGVNKVFPDQKATPEKLPGLQ